MRAILKTYPGLNIQFPISQSIASGIKTVETRAYSIPSKYLNKEMALIETPGPSGKFKARVIAILKFTNCFKYKSKKEFYLDSKRHLVTKESIWAWKNKAKFGWELVLIRKLNKPIELKQRKGIRFTACVEIDI